MSKYGLTEERYTQMMEYYFDDEEMVKEIVEALGPERCNKGYDIFDYDGTGLLDVEAIMDVGAFEDDDDATKRAEMDGIKIIPIDELPKDMPKKLTFYGWVDTEENRKNIEAYCSSHRYKKMFIISKHNPLGYYANDVRVKTDDIKDVYNIVLNITGNEKEALWALETAADMGFGGRYERARYLLECERE